MRNKRFINTTGYTPGTRTANNPVNIIPSQDITMKNVPYPLRATPLDEYGNPIGQSVLMQPEQDYFFEDADYVEEIPLPQMQMGGWNPNDPFSPQYSTEENPMMYQGQQPQQNILANLQPLPQLFTGASANFDKIRQNAETNMQQNTGVIVPEEEQGTQNQLYQFANPYSGQDFGSSLFNLGKATQNGDGLGIGVFGASTVLKGAKNFMQGMGAGNIEQNSMKSFYDNFRQNMTGNSQYLKNGGTMDKDSFKSLLKTNKIKNYIYNTETGNYEVEFE